MQIEEINPTNVLAEIANGTVFIDVREPFEIEESAYDIDGRIEIPLGEIDARINEIPKEKALIIGCRSGARSMSACQFLSSKGFGNIKNLQGGIMGWMNANQPVK